MHPQVTDARGFARDEEVRGPAFFFIAGTWETAYPCLIFGSYVSSTVFRSVHSFGLASTAALGASVGGRSQQKGLQHEAGN